MNNSTDKKIIKLKMIEDEMDRLKYVRNLKQKSTKYSIKPEVNDERADEDNDDVIESYSLYYIFSVFPSFVYYYI